MNMRQLGAIEVAVASFDFAVGPRVTSACTARA